MQNKFRHRSFKAELMDRTPVSEESTIKNLHELYFLNKYLGGHSASIKGIKRVIIDRKKIWHIADLGCGGGDTARHIGRWARSHNVSVKITGVDMNAKTISFFNDFCKEYPEIKGVEADYCDYLSKSPNADIIHCALFCHHLNDNELAELFNYINRNPGTVFIINDLQRNRLSYYLVWILTRVLNASRLAKHDGPLSVLRGFRRKELENFLQNARITNYSINRKWAFRFLITGYSNI